MALAEQVRTQSAPEAEFAALFAGARAGFAGPSWIQALRPEALAAFMRDGLPHKRIEAWKYTDFRTRFGGGLALAQGAGAGVSQPDLFDGLNAHRIVVDSGRVTQIPKGETLPDGLEVMSLTEAFATPALWLKPWLTTKGGALENLNLAFMTDGVLVRVGAKNNGTKPVLIHNRLSAAGVMANTRNVFMLEAGAELTIVEVDDGAPASQSFANAVSAIVLEPGARLRHMRITANGAPALVVHTDSVEVARDASYQALMFNAGPALARHETRIGLAGPGASLDVAGAYVAGDEEHADFALSIAHQAPHTNSRILVKGVAGGEAHAVVQGRVAVEPGAQKSDSHQLARAILLSPKAEVDHKPELEIFADDVKCGHGAAIGNLNDDQLFYMRSRGVPEMEARALLISAFLAEVVEKTGENVWRERIDAWLGAQLARVAGTRT